MRPLRKIGNNIKQGFGRLQRQGSLGLHRKKGLLLPSDISSLIDFDISPILAKLQVLRWEIRGDFLGREWFNLHNAILVLGKNDIFKTGVVHVKRNTVRRDRRIALVFDLYVHLHFPSRFDIVDLHLLDRHRRKFLAGHRQVNIDLGAQNNVDLALFLNNWRRGDP